MKRDSRKPLAGEEGAETGKGRDEKEYRIEGFHYEELIITGTTSRME